jgi:hypothetical protein
MLKFFFFVGFMAGMFFLASLVPYSRHIAFHAGTYPISWGILGLAIAALMFLRSVKAK